MKKNCIKQKGKNINWLHLFHTVLLLMPFCTLLISPVLLYFFVDVFSQTSNFCHLDVMLNNYAKVVQFVLFKKTRTNAYRMSCVSFERSHLVSNFPYLNYHHYENDGSSIQISEWLGDKLFSTFHIPTHCF